MAGILEIMALVQLATIGGAAFGYYHLRKKIKQLEQKGKPPVTR